MDAAIEGGQRNLVDQYLVELFDQHRVLAPFDEWREVGAAYLVFIGHMSTHFANDRVHKLYAVAKGRRDKQFPLLDCLRRFWAQDSSRLRNGLMFRRRKSLDQPSPLTTSKELLIKRFQEHRGQAIQTAAQLRTARDKLLAGTGQLTYDHIRSEFSKLARRLGWPPAATVKDFRHLFATNLENAGVPESYRRFYMGHAPGREAIVNYTHLNKIREHFLHAVEREFSLFVNAIEQRTNELRTLEN